MVGAERDIGLILPPTSSINPTTNTDGDQHSDRDVRTMRANHAVIDPIFIQYIIIIN
jgi:hypothetical protein